MGSTCPKCEVERPFRRYETTQQRQSWTCTVCGRHLHPTVGTIFHKSSTSLKHSVHVMYLMASTRGGISAKQVDVMGCTYKTAWRICNLIRNELMRQDTSEPLKGEVEADETWIGGRPHANSKLTNAEHYAKKATVLGMVERGPCWARYVPMSSRLVGPGHSSPLREA